MKLIFFILCFQLQIIAVYAQIDLTEQVINSTIRIVGIRDSIINGVTFKYQNTGTGFYFKYYIDNSPVDVIVTNSHVIKSCHTGYLKFKTVSDDSINYNDILELKINDFESKWIKHETEDLAIIPLQPILEEVYRLYHKIPATYSFTENDIPSDSALNNILAIEEVLMIGYPFGLSDDVHELPIVRKGLTATPVYMNYKNKNMFLLDIPIYKGSSGSPVCIINKGSYTDKSGVKLGKSRVNLLGIAVQSNVYTAKGHTISKDSIPELEVEIKLPFDVANVIKAKCLLDFKY